MLKCFVKEKSSFTTVERIGKVSRILNQASMTLALMTATDIVFYCGHQLLHQNSKSVLNRKSFALSYFSSAILLAFTIFTSSSFINQMICYKFSEKKEVKKRVVKKSSLDRSSIVDLVDDSSDLPELDQEGEEEEKKSESNPKEKINKLKEAKYIVNVPYTIKSIKTDPFMIKFISTGISSKALGKVINYFNLLPIVRIVCSSITILSMQATPSFQLGSFILVEVIFLIVITRTQIKHSAISSKLMLIITYMESLTFLCFGLANLGDFYNCGVKFINGFFQYFVLGLFVLTMIIEYIRLISIVFICLKNMVMSCKKMAQKRRRNKLTQNRKHSEKKEIEYWKKHEFVKLKRKLEFKDISEVTRVAKIEKKIDENLNKKEEISIIVKKPRPKKVTVDGSRAIGDLKNKKKLKIKRPNFKGLQMRGKEVEKEDKLETMEPKIYRKCLDIDLERLRLENEKKKTEGAEIKKSYQFCIY
jgi:hypothetical protein